MIKVNNKFRGLREAYQSTRVPITYLLHVIGNFSFETRRVHPPVIAHTHDIKIIVKKRDLFLA